jgi:hypothetical protein
MTERLHTVCLACAARGRFRWAIVSGACAEHRETVPADAAPITHDGIVGIDATETGA